MAKPDGRIEKGQRLSTAISARAWNRAQDAADIVLGVRPGVTAGAWNGVRGPYDVVQYQYMHPIGTRAQNQDKVLKVHHAQWLRSSIINEPSNDDEDIWQDPPAFGNIGSYVQSHRVAVAIEPIRDNTIGLAAIAGVWPAKLRMRAHQDQFAMLHPESFLRTSTNQFVDRFNTSETSEEWRLVSFPFAGFKIVWHPKTNNDTYPANVLGLVDLSQYHAQPIVLAKRLPSSSVAELYITPTTPTGLYVSPTYGPVVPSPGTAEDWLWLSNPFSGYQGLGTEQYFGERGNNPGELWYVIGTQLSSAQTVQVLINNIAYRVLPGSTPAPSSVLIPGNF